MFIFSFSFCQYLMEEFLIFIVFGLRYSGFKFKLPDKPFVRYGLLKNNLFYSTLQLGIDRSNLFCYQVFQLGAVAQMGERMTGSHEVRGSIPLSSTNPLNFLTHLSFSL